MATVGATCFQPRPWDHRTSNRVPSLTLQPKLTDRTTMANNHSEIEKRLWASADELRANSKLKSSEYSVPVLGLIFLRYADHKFTIAEKELAGTLIPCQREPYREVAPVIPCRHGDTLPATYGLSFPREPLNSPSP